MSASGWQDHAETDLGLAMDDFDIARLEAGHGFFRGEPYLEFIRAPSLSVGLYVLPAGAADPRGPHTEDEVYHIAEGRARIRVGGEDRTAAAGTVVFVEAGAEHRSHSIEEDPTVLVFFAPAEYAGTVGKRFTGRKAGTHATFVADTRLVGSRSHPPLWRRAYDGAQ